jgi:two-component system alkaline phosphatase synthesis response regulator PhoP
MATRSEDRAHAPLLLLADGDRDLRQLLERELESAGFRVTQAETGEEALERARVLKPVLAVLDRDLPLAAFVGGGSEVLRRLRAARDTAEMGVLLLTARDDDGVRIAALELGADDVMAKPFSLRELELRVEAVYRRVSDHGGGEDEKVQRAGRIEIDPASFVVRVDGARIATTMTEFRLLKALSDAGGRVCTREELLLRVSPGPQDLRGRVLRTQIRRLRLKLGPAGAQLETVHSVGYRLRQDR